MHDQERMRDWEWNLCSNLCPKVCEFRIGRASLADNFIVEASIVVDIDYTI